MSKYTGIIAIDLSKKGEQTILCQQADRLWLPKQVVLNGVVKVNPTDAVIQIRFSTASQAGGAWSVQDGYRNTESGDFHQLLVTVITPGASPFLYLETGQGVAGGYGSYDGLSPVIGLGATPPNQSPAKRA